MKEYFDLTKQYNFYHRYHKNSINRGIHIICIPLIVWSGAVFFSYIEFNNSNIVSNIKLYPLFGIVKFNGASIMATVYSAYYLILSLRLGIIMYFILYFTQITSYYFYLYVENAWIYAIMLHVLSWILQILGHIIFEKNRPAFKDNLVQSFLTAPIFVLIEFIDY